MGRIMKGTRWGKQASKDEHVVYSESGISHFIQNAGPLQMRFWTACEISPLWIQTEYEMRFNRFVSLSL